jgi:cytidyltransferase-like protein
VARIGLFPGSFKPYHAGHDAVVRQAAKENDEVIVFVSLKTRDFISGDGMQRVWEELIEPKLPSNVRVVYGGSPVGNAFKVLGDADKAGSLDTYTIYSDPEDADRFETLPKYAPNMVAGDRVKTQGLARTSTVNVSGTQMRQWFEAGDQQEFNKNLPRSIDAVRYWNILNATRPEKPVPKGAKAPKKELKDEALLRSYVREIINKG